MFIRLLDHRDRDRGASAIEYAALILISALIVGLLVSLLPGQFAPRAETAICNLFNPDDCGPTEKPSGNGQGGTGGQNPGGQAPDGQPSNGQPPSGQPPNGQPPNGQPSNGQPPNGQGTGKGDPPAKPQEKPKEGGLFDSLWGGTKSVFGELWHKFKEDLGSLWGMARGSLCSTGLCIPDGDASIWHQLTPQGWWENFSDQWKHNWDIAINLAKAPVVSPYNWGKQAWQDLQDGNYVGAAWNGFWAITPGSWLIRPMIFGPRFEENLANHRYAAAVTDVVYNIGTLFIPTPTKITKLSKLGKVGKTGTEIGKVEKALDDVSKTAKAAEKAAKGGNLAKSRELLRQLAEKRQKARQEAKAAGCPIALGPPRRPGIPLTGVPAAVTAPPPATFTLTPGLPGNAANAPPAPLLASQAAVLPIAGPPCKEARQKKEAERAQQKALNDTRAALKTHLMGMGLTEQEAEALLAALQRAGNNGSESFDDLLKTLTTTGVNPQLNTSVTTAVKRIGEAAATGRVGDAGYADILDRINAQLASAKGSSLRVRDVQLEVENALSVIKTAPLKPGTKVELGAKGEVDLGNGYRVNLDAISDGDVVYVTGRGNRVVYHVDDTKGTWSAVVDKVTGKNINQLMNMGKWAQKDPKHREATYYVSSESKTDLNDIIESTDALNNLIKYKVGIQVNGRRYSPTDLKNARRQGSFDGIPGRPGY